VAEPVDMRAAEVQTTAVVEEVTVIITEHLHPEQTDTLQLAVAVAAALVRLMVPISAVAQVPLEVVAEALDFTVKGALVVAAALEVQVVEEDLAALAAAEAMEVVMEVVAVVQADTIIPTSAVQQQLDLVLQVLFVLFGQDLLVHFLQLM